MKITFFEIEEWEEQIIRDNLKNHEISFDLNPLDANNLEKLKDCEILSIFIYSNITKEIIEKLPNLKLIVTRSTGYDHIDLAACKDKNIVVTNIPSYGVHTVAEHTFALLLALSRKLIPSVERAKSGDFSLDGLRGFDLYGKTFGVIGVGNIGKVVIEIAKGFGMNTLAFTRHEQDALEAGAKYAAFDELLSLSDIVSLHLPYTKETHHIINKENISKFKKGSILINTARGALIETEAILIGIENGYLAGVGLDVLEEEVMLKEERQLLTQQFSKESDIKTQLINHVLLNRENVVITPHNAFNSTESLNKIIEITMQNILDFIDNKPQNIIEN